LSLIDLHLRSSFPGAPIGAPEGASSVSCERTRKPDVNHFGIPGLRLKKAHPGMTALYSAACVALSAG
jgi:hypothetical protein